MSVVDVVKEMVLRDSCAVSLAQDNTIRSVTVRDILGALAALP